MILHKRIIKKYLTSLNIIQPDILYPYLGWHVTSIKTLFMIKVLFDVVFNENHLSLEHHHFAVRMHNGVKWAVLRYPK